MKIDMILNENETINNLSFAEAIYAECGRNDMKRCENCIHDKVCDMWAVVAGIPFVNADTCENFSPAVDVAPKSDVAREIFEEIDEELGGLMNDYHKSKRFSDADVIRYARCLIAELKKKYTEGESNGCKQ